MDTEYHNFNVGMPEDEMKEHLKQYNVENLHQIYCGISEMIKCAENAKRLIKTEARNKILSKLIDAPHPPEGVTLQ